MTIDEAERALIEATLRRTGNNKTQAAIILWHLHQDSACKASRIQAGGR